MGYINLDYETQEAVIEAAKTWRLNQINGTANADATGALCRAIDRLLIECDLIDEDTKALFRRHQRWGIWDSST